MACLINAAHAAKDAVVFGVTHPIIAAENVCSFVGRSVSVLAHNPLVLGVVAWSVFSKLDAHAKKIDEEGDNKQAQQWKYTAKYLSADAEYNLTIIAKIAIPVALVAFAAFTLYTGNYWVVPNALKSVLGIA